MYSYSIFVQQMYRLQDTISLAHAPVHVTDFPIVNVHVDELSSARIWLGISYQYPPTHVKTQNTF